jgi:PAS domain S-box-containing protein
MTSLALDDVPMCGVLVDRDGKAVTTNSMFGTVMGPLYKFTNYPFTQAASTPAGKAELQAAVQAVQAGEAARERVRNVEMLTLAGASGLPVNAHFDWFISRGKEEGTVLLMGDPCSDGIVVKRAKDSELIDFFQNAPIALHWLSGTGHVMWANQTELDTLGYTAEEYIGQPIMKFCPDERELVLEIFKTLGSGNTIKDVPVRFRTKAGKIVPLLIDSNVAYKVDESGEKVFNHTRCFIRDDTGRRVRQARGEAKLREARRTQKLFDAYVSRACPSPALPLPLYIWRSLCAFEVRSSTRMFHVRARSHALLLPLYIWNPLATC